MDDDRPTLKDELRTLTGDDKARVLQTLGEERLAHWNATAKTQHPILVLTATMLHQAGLYLVADEDGRTRKERGAHTIALNKVSGFTVTEKAVPRWVGMAGKALVALGSLFMVATMIEGSVMAVTFGLFVGVAWMVVPGVLTLMYVKSGAQKLLAITHADGSLTVPVQEFDEDAVAAFLKTLGEKTRT